MSNFVNKLKTRVRPIHTSDIDNIKAKPNSKESVASLSVCWYWFWKNCEKLQRNYCSNCA